MKRGGIHEAIADLHFKIVRAAAVVPDSWDHATIKDVHMHLGKSAGVPKPSNERMSHTELLPHRLQGLNRLACSSGRDQHRQTEIAAWDSPASRARVHHQDRIHMRMCREDILNQLGHLSVDLRRESERGNHQLSATRAADWLDGRED